MRPEPSTCIPGKKLIYFLNGSRSARRVGALGKAGDFLRRLFSRCRIQRQIIWLYGILLMALGAILLLIITPSMTRLLNESSQDIVSQLAITLGTQVDEQLRGMDQIARQVVYSDDIINDFLRPREKPRNLYLPLNMRRAITNRLYDILTPSIAQFNQLSIVDTETGNYIGIGMYPLQTLISVREINNIDWVRETREAGGNMCVIPPHKELWRESDRNVFSVALSFKSYSDKGQNYSGIVEIPCDTEFLIRLFEEARGENKYVEKLFLFAQDGSPIYASHPSEAQAYRELLGSLENQELLNDRTEGLLGYARLELAEWRIVIQADQGQVNSSLSHIILKLVMTIVAGVILAQILSFYLSRQLTRPIQQIYQSINQLQVSNRSVEVSLSPKARGNELEQLRDTFDRLCSKLDQAVNEAALARTCEMESRMAALEAQINPHFLYNTFAMIQTMADCNACSDVSAICSDLSGLLRYSIGGDNAPSTISSELHSCSTYLGIMYRRHYTQLSFSISMDPELEHRPIPRMILQPLVENCIKHGLQRNDSWRVGVHAVREGDSWYITVSDNGAGFPQDTIQYVYDAIATEERALFSGGGGGKHIGLVNTGIRLKLFFGDDLIFEIRNLPEGGSCVRLGSKRGMCDEQTEKADGIDR